MSSLISKAISFSLWPSALKTIPFSRERLFSASAWSGALGSGIGSGLLRPAGGMLAARTEALRTLDR